MSIGYKHNTKVTKDWHEEEEMRKAMDFNSLVEIYLEDSKFRHRPSTYNSKCQIFKNYILPFFSAMPINTITPGTVRFWQNRLLNENDHFSDRYKRKIHMQLSAVLNYAVKFHGLANNPCKLAGPIGSKKSPRMKFWTKHEFDQFIRSFEKTSPYHTIFNILFYTGIRIGELLALTLDDINFEKETLFISKSYMRINKVDYLNPPKTPRSNREIAIPKFLCAMLRNHEQSLENHNRSERLFKTNRQAVNKTLKLAAEKSEVKQIRTHDLRHSHASLLLELGFSTILVSERLGHENIKTTLDTYSHLYPEKHIEVADKLDAILNEDKIHKPIEV